MAQVKPLEMSARRNVGFPLCGGRWCRPIKLEMGKVRVSALGDVSGARASCPPFLDALLWP